MKDQRPDALGDAASELLPGIVRGIALTIEVFLHTEIGLRYIDCGLVAVPTLVIFANLFPQDEGRPLRWFIAAFLLVWGWKYISSIVHRVRRGKLGHSRYTGYPLAMRLVPHWREHYVKHLEGIVVIAIGWGIHRDSRPLADYLIFAAAVMLARNALLEFQLHCRALDLHDSSIEQRIVADKFRQMR